jgi:hypothetical protein
VSRPRFQINDRVVLAGHTRSISPYDGKPFVSKLESVLRVSSISGTGSKRSPWQVSVTDDLGHFWQLQPDDLVKL